MKRILIIIFSLVMVLPSLGQGSLLFNNRLSAFGIDAPVYDSVIGGSRLEGSSYQAQLWVSTPSDPSLFFAVGNAVGFRTGLAAGYVDVGINSSRVVPDAEYGSFVYAQIRAWTPVPGFSSYEESVAVAYSTMNPEIKFGQSAPVYVSVSASALSTPSPLLGIQSFAITSVVPEPRFIYLFFFLVTVFFFFLPKRA